MPTTKPKIFTICALILFSGAALSVGFYFSLKSSNELKRDKIFTNLYNSVHSNIQHEIERNLNALNALRASYLAFGNWDRQEFGQYASYYTRQIHSIQALEWVPVIKQAQRDSFELATRLEGYQDFEIFTRDGSGISRAEQRPVYYPVYFIEPFEGNEAAFGFDPGPSSATRQNAIDQAIRTHEAAGSDVITIIQKTNPHKAILVFVPIFSRKNANEIIGLVEGVYLMERLVMSAMEDLDLPEEITLTISSIDDNEVLLGDFSSLSDTSYIRHGQLVMADRTWDLHVAYKGDPAPYVISPFWLLIASLVFTLLIVKVVYDVLTDNRAELLRNYTELKKKNHDLEQYTYAASHDLQEPLHSIQSLVDLINQDCKAKLEDKDLTYLDHIRNASQRMSDLITNMLRYSQIGQTETYALTDFQKLVENVKKDLKEVIDAKQAQVIINPPLPTLEVYPTSIELLLYHLISNGLKFQAADNKPKIEISARQKGNNNWEFAVKDNGIGFSEEFSERIFSIFKTLHSRSIYPGSGFGLANCKKIIDLHNGKIWVKSSPGNGSTFFFTLNPT